MPENIIQDMDRPFSPSVMTLPDNRGSVAFVRDYTHIFREQQEVAPVEIMPGHSYIPWGAANTLPYEIMEIFDRDETMSTCMLFNKEICYGAGLSYNTGSLRSSRRQEVSRFVLSSDFPCYFLGICSDIKMFEFAVTVLTISPDGRKITSLSRREACYCRFSEPDRQGNIRYVYYANWRLSNVPQEIECIEILPHRHAIEILNERVKAGRRKFAVISRMPAADFACYPIPHYASLIKGRWYNIKQLIGTAKEASLRNSAPIKYQIEISDRYWDRIFHSEGITSREKQKNRVEQAKQEMIEFLTGAENSGKVLFSSYYITPDGKENRDVTITKIDTEKQGGDWATDLQEAINMICFTFRVHSNLVGSVPGKSQSNNSGSDKRELHTIAQATQKSWRDIMFHPHLITIEYNGWQGAFPECPFIQLTTLDQHTDATTATV